jgi:hypothetical protein
MLRATMTIRTLLLLGGIGTGIAAAEPAAAQGTPCIPGYYYTILSTAASLQARIISRCPIPDPTTSTLILTILLPASPLRAAWRAVPIFRSILFRPNMFTFLLSIPLPASLWATRDSAVALSVTALSVAAAWAVASAAADMGADDAPRRHVPRRYGPGVDSELDC